MARSVTLGRCFRGGHVSPNTPKSYCNYLRRLIEFLAEHGDAQGTRDSVLQGDATLVREFLSHFEGHRGNTVAIRNRRLAALRSLFLIVGRFAPELVAHSTDVNVALLS